MVSVSKKTLFLVAALAAGVALAVLVLLAMRKKRQEGWEPKEDGSGATLDLEGPHAERVMRACRDGMSFGAVMKNEEWDYMKKYNKADLWKLALIHI